MDLYLIVDTVRVVLCTSVLIVASLYAGFIICFRRFHNQNNVFIVNFCINTICTGIYFTVYFYAVDYTMPESLCILFHYTFNVASVQIPFAFVAFTIHRFVAIVYHIKGFFKTKRWVFLCISTQWISQFLISIPFIFARRRSCTANLFWMGVYTVVTAIVLPLMLNMIFNIWIFIFVRKSSRRLQQQQSRISQRDINLLKQMIFIFSMFIIGWTPGLVINTVTTVASVDIMIKLGSIFLSLICLAALMINLFIYNHDVRQFLSNALCRCFH